MISVVIPIYNAGKKLHQCLRSVLAQTVSAIEIILVNDGSTDDSYSICLKYASIDTRIRLVDQPQAGSIAARRKGVELASAPYVTFVDADDWLAPAMLERLLKVSVVHNADIVVCNTYRVLDSSALVKRANRSRYFCEGETVYRDEAIRSELVPSFLHGHSFPASLHGKLYRRELVASCGNYLDEIHYFGDDLYYNLEIFLLARSIVIISEPLYYYRAGGFTSRYMPELLHDAIVGYRIQQAIIEQYYPHEERESHYIGSNLMLLNTLRTYLRKIFEGDLTREERLSRIGDMCRLPEVVGCVNHEPTARLVHPRFVRALHSGDYAYLEQDGRWRYTQSRIRNWALLILSAFNYVNFDKLRNKFSNSEDTIRQHIRIR